MFVADMSLPPVQYQEYASPLSFDWTGFTDWGGEYDYYPAYLNVMGSPSSGWYRGLDEWDVVDTGYSVPSGTITLNRYAGFVVYAVQCTEWRGDSVSNPTTAYYVRDSSGLLGSTLYYRLTAVDCQTVFVTGPIGPGTPGNGSTFDTSNLLGSLIEFGGMLLSDDNALGRLINYDIGGVPLWQLMLSGGLMVYVSWAIVKWVIPT